MKIDAGKYKILSDAMDKTLTDYEINWFDAENCNGYIDEDSLISIIEDLLCEIDRKDEQIEELTHEKIIYPNEERDREREVLGI